MTLPPDVFVEAARYATSKSLASALIIVRAPAAEDAPSPPPDRRFPVLDKGSRTIPWALVEPLRASALRFHSQTLERLAERGGLLVRELHMHMHGLKWPLRDDSATEKWFMEWIDLCS